MCTYYKVDLHVHSPCSTDYRGDRSVSPHRFVSDFVSRGFDLIAITDHNSGTFIDGAIEARNRIASSDGKNITVLPGVELHVSPGVHLLAIFPDGGSELIKDLLSRAGMPSDQQGDMSKLISLSINEVAQIVHERNGLLIGAHCNSSKGVIEVLEGQPRLEWLRLLDALDINSASDDTKVDKTVAYVNKNLGVSIPLTFGSDSHDSSCATTGMWVKMAEPTFRCLRQLIFEPELRISRTEPVALNHGRIVAFTTTHGIYANERFRYSPHLNTLLGGRGAGKSAAIDLMRFALEAKVRAGDSNNQIFDNRIRGFLQSVGGVLVVVVGADQNTYLISRSGEYEKPDVRAEPSFTKSAEVFQIIDDALIPRDLRPLDVLGVEFYGQGEVALLADRVNEQLRLIDENLDHSESTDSIARVQKNLIDNELDQLKFTQEIEELRVEAAKEPALEARRCTLENSLADPIFKERTIWDDELVWINKQVDWIKNALSQLPESIPPPLDSPVDIAVSPAKSVLEYVQRLTDQVAQDGQVDLIRLRKKIIQAKAKLEGYKLQWNEAFEGAKTRYKSRLVELGVANLAEVASEQRAVDRELKDVKTRVVPKINEIESKVLALRTNRARLLEELSAARSDIAQSRSRFVAELNSQLGGDVVIDLSGTDTALYIEAVNEPLRGSKMIHRANQISIVCDRLDPTTFVEIIRSHSISELTAIGVTENNAHRIIGNLDEKHLFRIERVDVPQSPKIRVKREGDAAYTNLTDLSVGEKCSAVLSIALLGKGKPLVIDQPEDDLDHAFIINSIVQSIRTVKPHRQIIAATHNPNIPVLGDAEMVFRVARKTGDDVCEIQCSGGLELPQITLAVQSLEGGAEAFERRRQRYSVPS